MPFKCGRLPAVHSQRSMRSALALFKALAPLGTPPAVSTDYVSAVMKQSPTGFEMLGNDSVGDCTMADSGHQIMVHTANVGQIIIPTTQDVLSAYSALTGFDPSKTQPDGSNPTDTGADESAVCNFMQTTGICGQKSAANAMVDPTNLDHIKWAVQVFGACRLGIVVNDLMQQQFSSGQPWETAAAANDPDAGGHDVPAVKYDANFLYVVTWGGLQPVAWSLVANSAFLEESHAEVFLDFITAGGTTPTGFSLATLLDDLQVLKAA